VLRRKFDSDPLLPGSEIGRHDDSPDPMRSLELRISDSRIRLLDAAAKSGIEGALNLRELV
jgi:hypothetical protein